MPYQIPTYETDTDLTVTNAFVVLHHFLYQAGPAKDKAVFRVYRNAARFIANPDKPCGVITVLFDINPVGGNFIVQANNALLLLPEMAGSVQV